MFKICIAFLILAIPFILIILGLANVKEKMFTAFLQIYCGTAILLVMSWDWVKDWRIVAHTSLGEALLILPMYVFALIVGLKMLGGTKSNETHITYHSHTPPQFLSDSKHEHENGIDYKSRVNCSYMANAIPDEVKVTMPKPEIPKKSTGKGINFKYVGVAAMGVVLGAVGLYKFFGKKQ